MKDIEEFKKQAEIAAQIKSITIDELEVIIGKHILLSDKYVLKVLIASVIGNKISGLPVWLFLVGPSGGGKTMFLDMMRNMSEIYPLSNLTPNTFISGQQQTKGLLWEMNGKIVTFKDFTTILQLYQESRNEIMSQLREIYDGSYKKAFGTGQVKEWTGKIGFIAGVTSVIDVTQQLYSSLGERFIQYRLETPDREEVGMIALRNSSRNKKKQEEARLEMQMAFEGCVRAVEQEIGEDDSLELSDELARKLVHIVNFATLSRSPVLRSNTSSREIYYKPTSEMPTRFVEQLNHIAIALMYINKVITKKAIFTPTDEEIIYKIAFDSVPMMRRIMLKKLTELGIAQTSVIATLTNYPTNTARMNLEELNVLGIIDRKKSGNIDYWQTKNEWRNLLTKYDGVKIMTEAERLAAEAEAAEKLIYGEGEKESIQQQQPLLDGDIHDLLSQIDEDTKKYKDDYQ